MADVNGVKTSSPLAALQQAGRTLRISPATPNTTQTSRRTDTISFSQAAERLRAGQAQPASTPTYGIQAGLQATTPAAARQALGQAGQQLIAARVEAPMDFAPGMAPSRGGMPFYTNPATANSVSTTTNATRLGGSIDTSG